MAEDVRAAGFRRQLAHEERAMAEDECAADVRTEELILHPLDHEHARPSSPSGAAQQPVE